MNNKTADYIDVIPSWADVMTVEDFKSAVERRAFTDYDGSGCPVKDGKMDWQYTIYPSTMEVIPEDATHIVWFNK